MRNTRGINASGPISKDRAKYRIGFLPIFLARIGTLKYEAKITIRIIMFILIFSERAKIQIESVH